MASIKDYKPFQWVRKFDAYGESEPYLLDESDFYGVGRKNTDFFNGLATWIPQEQEMVMVYSLHNPNIFLCGKYSKEFMELAEKIIQKEKSESYGLEPYIGKELPLPIREF